MLFYVFDTSMLYFICVIMFNKYIYNSCFDSFCLKLFFHINFCSHILAFYWPLPQLRRFVQKISEIGYVCLVFYYLNIGGLYRILFKYKIFFCHILVSTLKMWSLTKNSLSSCRCFMDSLSLFFFFPYLYRLIQN